MSWFASSLRLNHYLCIPLDILQLPSPYDYSDNTMKSCPPLLITSAVRPASAELVELSSIDDRLAYTAEAITQWLKIFPDLHIVICDGSNFDLREFVLTQWPNASIEILFFLNDEEKVSQRGKGYGEGEIIAYALKHSKTLKRADRFMKCTSKLWVNDVEDLLEDCGPTQFHIRGRKTQEGIWVNTWVDTRFYIVQKNFYRRHLLNTYKNVHREQKFFLEHAFLEKLVSLSSLPHILFPRKPEIRGVSGTSGLFYGLPRGEG